MQRSFCDLVLVCYLYMEGVDEAGTEYNWEGLNYEMEPTR